MKRFVLKMSGEALRESGEQAVVDDSRLYRFVEDLRAAIAAASAPTQIAIVVGGGNIHRGPDLPRIRRTESDRLGMIGTLFNANVVAEYCDLVGLKSVVMSASFAPAFGEYYSVSRCLRFWEDGYVIVFGCGLGVGGFTTDTAAAQRAYDWCRRIVVREVRNRRRIHSRSECRDSRHKVRCGVA